MAGDKLMNGRANEGNHATLGISVLLGSLSKRFIEDSKVPTFILACQQCFRSKTGIKISYLSNPPLQLCLAT